MSNAPSRSEIESALSGRTKNAKPQPRPVVKSDIDFDEPPRRQQVIGGDLTGVNQRNKFGLFSRYSDINLANWIAAIVVILIVVAFFWPQKQDSVTEIAKQVESNRIIEIEEQTRQFTETDNGSFARETDANRANQFREIDARDEEIRGLLSQAAELIRERKFTLPDDDNAVAVYKRVLALNPKNADAKDGLNKIKQHFLARGVSALESGSLQVAEANLEKIDYIDAQSYEYEDLALAIGEFKTQAEIKDLLGEAKKASRKNNLILPARESAISYYQQVLELDEQNKEAIDGIKSIADKFINQANQSVLAGEFDAAAAQLATVTLIDPDHKSIPLIQKMISHAKPLAESASRTNQANANSPSSTSSKLSIAPSAATVPSSTTQSTTAPSATDRESTQTSRTASSETVNRDKTPARQANEQEQFDKQYLQQGLDAYYSGEYDKAAALLQPLADKGIARAQMRLAYMHFLGRGFPKSRIEADKIVRATLPVIRKFANEGRGWAQSDLGSLYEDGLVLPRDYGEAVYWYRTAAEKGYPGAQTNLGLMYARGRGVAASRRTAIEWFQRAAKQGDDVAKRNLAALGVN